MTAQDRDAHTRPCLRKPFICIACKCHLVPLPSPTHRGAGMGAAVAALHHQYMDGFSSPLGFVSFSRFSDRMW